jgi:hypothetical protein
MIITTTFIFFYDAAFGDESTFSDPFKPSNQSHAVSSGFDDSFDHHKTSGFNEDDSFGNKWSDPFSSQTNDPFGGASASSHSASAANVSFSTLNIYVQF